MLGAIAGDICCSIYEGGQCEPERFRLFSEGAAFTDDTVCTVAIAEALLHGGDIAAGLRAWVRRYPRRGYGGRFLDWAHSDGGPYNSFANGGAMRVSPAGLLARSIEEAETLADLTAEVTHNHPEGLRGARTIAGAIWLARQQPTTSDLRRELVRRYGYRLQSVRALRADFGFSVRADATVPIALTCVLEGPSWQQAVTNAAAIGGDSDTVACMAGGIAEAWSGLLTHHANAALAWLPDEMSAVLAELYDRAGVAPPWVG